MQRLPIPCGHQHCRFGLERLELVECQRIVLSIRLVRSESEDVWAGVGIAAEVEVGEEEDVNSCVADVANCWAEMKIWCFLAVSR